MVFRVRIAAMMSRALPFSPLAMLPLTEGETRAAESGSFDLIGSSAVECGSGAGAIGTTGGDAAGGSGVCCCCAGASKRLRWPRDWFSLWT